MHVLTPTVMEILAQQVADAGERGGVTLSAALAVLATREKYLALEERAWRYDVGVKYGLLTAQLALALSGQDREDVLARLLELVAQRELGAGRR
jgi:UTP--glucose-1-phosphate uridylyltransferase